MRHCTEDLSCQGGNFTPVAIRHFCMCHRPKPAPLEICGAGERREDLCIVVSAGKRDRRRCSGDARALVTGR